MKGYFSTFLENIKNSNKDIYLLNDKKVKWAKNISLNNYDVIIFTSKNAIEAIDYINKDWKKIPSYVISEQTAKLVKDLNGNLDYISKTKQ